MNPTQQDREILKHASTPDLVNVREQELSRIQVDSNRGAVDKWGVAGVSALSSAAALALLGYPIVKYVLRSPTRFSEYMTDKVTLALISMSGVIGYFSESDKQKINQEHNRINVVDELLADRGVAVVKTKDSVGRPVTAIVSTAPQDTKIAQTEHKGTIAQAIGKVLG